MCGAILNGLLKLGFADPRPAWSLVEPKSYQMWHSFGMPSGHAQSATIWLLVPLKSRSARGVGIAILYALFMGYSRVAIDAHSWLQVVMGWTVGICLVFAFRWFEDLNHIRWRSLPWSTFLILATVVCFGTLGVAASTIEAIPAEKMAAWHNFVERHALQARQSPASLNTVSTPLAALLGLLVGGMVDRVHTEAHMTRLQKAKRVCMGGIVLGLVYVITRYGVALLDPEGARLVARAAGAALLGALISGVLPALFRRRERASLGPSQSM